MHLRIPLIALLLVLAHGCSEENEPDSTPDAGQPDAFPDAMVDAGSLDTGPPDTGLPPDVCEALGLARRPFLSSASTYNFGDVAGDFTINQLDGTTWSLEEHWTGCESFVFLMYVQTNSSAPKYEDRFWDSDPEPLLDNPGLNTQFFFLSIENHPLSRRDRVEAMKNRIDALIDARFTDEEDRAKQKARFHYVLDAPREVSGSLGGFLADYWDYMSDRNSRVDLGTRGWASPPIPFMFAIDRDQEWDSGGSPDEHVGGDPALRMASYLPMFFDHKAEIRDALAVETGVETFELLDEDVTDRVFEREATLPQDLASYDTMEFDVTVECKERNVFACSEWDRIARIQHCATTSTDCTDRTELVRWITPYWRRGERRWVMDASPLLGTLSGGTERFRIVMGPSWERATERRARVALRLQNRGGPRSRAALFAFGGGTFNTDYNTRDPFRFTPPNSATKVELVVILSGHGQESGNNCAEWCDHRHQFAVNGTDLDVIQHVGDIGSVDGCGPAAGGGVSPGQWGNWAPERAYWCPGLPVEPIRINITSHLTLGQENQLTYSGNYRGLAPAGGNISLSAYVVWYE